VFAVAARAYRLMLDERRNQSILISGESGMLVSFCTGFLLPDLVSKKVPAKLKLQSSVYTIYLL
jgi:hypothetical protein